MKPKTLVLLFLAIPLLGYALVYAYVWFSAKQDLEYFAAQLAPVADVRYTGLRVSPTGSIAIHDLSIAPRQAGGEVRVDRVDLKTPGIDFLLTGARSLREGRIPRRLGLAFTGIRIATEGPFWSQVNQQFSVGDPQRPDSGLACDIASIVRMQGLVASLLPAQIVIDLEYLFEKGADRGTALIHLRMRQRGFSTVGLDAQVGHLGERLADAWGAAHLDAVVMTAALDPDYTRQAQRLCAEASHLPVDRFLPTLLAQDERAYLRDIGIVPGAGLRTLLQDYLSGAVLEVRITPPAGLDLAAVRNYRPEDVPQLLHMQVTLNGARITDLGFRTMPGSVPNVVPGAVPSIPPPAAPPPSTAVPQTEGPPPGNIGFADLARCTGRSVLITLRDGRERRGLVDRLDHGVVYLKHQIQEGWVTMPVREGDVAEVRLLGARSTR